MLSAFERRMRKPRNYKSGVVGGKNGEGKNARGGRGRAASWRATGCRSTDASLQGTRQDSSSPPHYIMARRAHNLKPTVAPHKHRVTRVPCAYIRNTSHETGTRGHSWKGARERRKIGGRGRQTSVVGHLEGTAAGKLLARDAVDVVHPRAGARRGRAMRAITTAPSFPLPAQSACYMHPARCACVALAGVVHGDCAVGQS